MVAIGWLRCVAIHPLGLEAMGFTAVLYIAEGDFADWNHAHLFISSFNMNRINTQTAIKMKFQQITNLKLTNLGKKAFPQFETRCKSNQRMHFGNTVSNTSHAEPDIPRKHNSENRTHGKDNLNRMNKPKGQILDMSKTSQDLI